MSYGQVSQWLQAVAVYMLTSSWALYSLTDIAHTSQKLECLLGILETLRYQTEGRIFQADEQNLLQNIESYLEQCEECIDELADEANKFEQKSTDGIRTAAKATARLVAYPFRQSTLQKLDEDIDEIVAHLSLALQLLQLKDIGQVQDDIEDVKALLGLVRSSQISSTIRDWLQAPDATIDFNEACKKKHPGTGLWFVKGSAFTTWLEKPESFLWLNGFAGCGKSVLCSTAIQYTYRYRRSNPQVGIAFFFFTFNDYRKQNTSAMLRALVLQLSSQIDRNYTLLSRLHNSYLNATPPDHALLDCLRQLVRIFRDVYIILDALDESPREKHQEAVLQVLNDLRNWSEPGLHLLVTSREEVEIREELEAIPEDIITMKNDAVDKDIASIVSQHLRDNRRLRKWKEYYGRIETTLTQRTEGLFRWVECQFKALIGCPQSEDLLDQLLESLPDTLDETYERMLGNIPRTSQAYARQMLTLLCGAKRPLTVSELIDGIAVELGDTPRFNAKRKLKDSDAIQQVCPGFIELDRNLNPQRVTVRIAHFSVQEYLESERIRQHKAATPFSVQKQDADTQIACICLPILLNRELQSLKDSEEIRNKYPLAHYAAQHWVHHFLDSSRDEYLEEQAAQLCCYLRVDTLSDLLNDQSGQYGTALQAASVKGHEKIVQLLLEKGADIHVQAEHFGTVLQAASYGGDEKIVQLLLEKGADIHVQATCFWTALQAASFGGHEKIDNLEEDVSDSNTDIESMQSICIEETDQSSDRQRLSYWLNGVGEDEDDSLRCDPYSSFWNANYTPPELIPHMGFNPEMVQEFGLISGNGTHRICAEEVRTTMSYQAVHIRKKKVLQPLFIVESLSYPITLRIIISALHLQKSKTRLNLIMRVGVV
ncbi:uncharacterized protein BCR38DRAFT_471936 [Pseudomassariella vexata]|uniref:NACHT domain-containing protein n=1 Tax=Pseudomassariella vexata TaxID=1141098 RepID=A0A1Y2EAD5_9PEZI|nr:uncharacterized protein BCR38DRAFT_471936 [Pseudomassariella vexata]ORY68357.1 hypothetical protein BCR38DRAFT_471936 [Pseudomassariella vexata]